MRQALTYSVCGDCAPAFWNGVEGRPGRVGMETSWPSCRTAGIQSVWGCRGRLAGETGGPSRQRKRLSVHVHGAASPAAW